MPIKCSARPGLIAGKFRTGSLEVLETRWSDLDATNEAVRKDLMQYVPSHVRIAPGQDEALAACGLAMKDGKLVDLKMAVKPPTPPPAKGKTEK